MRPSLKGLKKRAADSADRAAAGTPVPAGQDPPTAQQLRRAGARERGAMRRRLRKLKHAREALVGDLGGLVVELHRHGRTDSPLIGQRVQQIAAIDAEMRGLAQALGSELTLGQVVVAGIAGTCTHCGTILATSDRFCSNCGTAVTFTPDGQPAQAVQTAPPPTVPAVGEKPPPPAHARPLGTAPAAQAQAAPDGDGQATKPPPPAHAKPLETAAPPPAAR
jgi:predicted regulator of Ras-like GTPase activity (Roadblock/LC7/MglB family)